MSTTAEVHPLQDHNTFILPLRDNSATVLPIQDHKTIHNLVDVKNTFPSSFNKIGSMPGKYAIICDPYVLPVQHWRCRVPIEAKEEIEKQPREMITP